MRAVLAIGCLTCCCACLDGADAVGCDLRAARAEFSSVSAMLAASCGSLDCHGQLGRPLRLYSGRGLRLDPDELSGHGGTRSAEHEANLHALVGLEPELTCAVLSEGGRDPERLTIVRKATGAEAHRGGAVLSPRAAGTRCLLRWLAGRVDSAVCRRAAELERPE